MRTRTRDIDGLNSWSSSLVAWESAWKPPFANFGPWHYYSTLVPESVTAIPALSRSRQITTDENHSLRDINSLRVGATGDVGGPFDSVKMGIDSKVVPQVLAGSSNLQDNGNMRQIRYYGPVFATNPTALSVGDFGTLRRNLKPVGTTAIARCKPTNHISNLAVDFFELYREGLPKIPGRHLWETKTEAMLPKQASGEFLNSEFGWLPLVSDIRDASYAAANSHRLMNAYVENSGKPVRRGYDFPVEETVTVEDLGEYEGYVTRDPSMVWGFVDGTMSTPRLQKITKTYRKTWFRGCFTYYLPIEYTSRWQLAKFAAEAGHLYGIELTPDVVWKAAPWTWAIDWFSNMGDVVSNLSDWATDGLVMRYGYVMETIIHEVTYALDRPCRLRLASNSPGVLFSGHAYARPVTVYYESKQRVQATPFGFEASWNGLSNRQWVIAAALSITRLFG